MSRWLAVALAVALTGPAFAQKEFGFDNRKGSGQPYLKPEETVARMKVADGFEVKLFAAEPQLVNPIAMTVDEKGRVWVVECFEYPKRTAKGKMPRDRVKILEDTDGDGVCDKVTTFIEGKDFPVPFDLASGIEVGNGGVYLGAPPYLFFIENKNDTPGKIDILLKGFGSQDTHETLNTFQWGPDGRLYGLHGVFTYSEVSPGQGDGPTTRMNAAVWRYDTKTKKFEVFSEGTSNPWGMDWRNTDGEFILCCCVIPHLFHMVPGGNYKRQGGLPSSPYFYGEIKEICDHTFHKESGWAHAGLISLDTPLMPEKFRNSVIFGSIHGCSIKQNILKPNGSSYTASRGDDFLVSGDKNFRPINLRWGHNGEIYCNDWHDQNPCHQTQPDDWDYARGRVYRIQPKGMKTRKAADLGAKKAPELTELLRDQNPYLARTAFRLLSEQAADLNDVEYDALREIVLKDPSSALAARLLLARPNPRGTGPGVQELKLLFGPFSAEHAGFRARLIRLLRDGQRRDPAMLDVLTGVASKEKDVNVRREIASLAIAWSADAASVQLVRVLLGRGDDASDPMIPQLLWVAYEPHLSRSAPEELDWIKAHSADNALVGDTIIPRAMRRLVATGKREDLGLCLTFIADLSEAGMRAKALDALVSGIGNRTADAPAEWEAVQTKLAADASADVKRLTNSLAVKFRDAAAVHRAMAAAGDERLKVDERLAALRDLAVVRSPGTAPFLIQLVRGNNDPQLKAEAIRALGGIDVPKVSADLLAEWGKFTPVLRNEVVQVLSGRKDWASDLLKAVGDKKVERTALNDNTVLRIQALKDNRLNAEVEKVWGRLRATPAELTALINKMRHELEVGPGSFNRGRLVFDNQCAKCHKFDGRGHQVGPDIEGAGRDIEYLLANVLDPNRVIGAPYFMRTVNLLNGRVETGVLQAEDDQSITLKTENAVLKQIQKKDIDDIKVQEKSLMPEGLGNNMSVQDFRDLVRYTMAHPFITRVEQMELIPEGDSKEPKAKARRPEAGVTGRLTFPFLGEKPTRVVIDAKVFAPEDMTVRLLVGSWNDYTASVGGGQVNGKGSGRDPQPDQSSVELKLKKGENGLRVATTYQGKGQAVYLRFHDPDRKLRYPDAEVVAPPK